MCGSCGHCPHGTFVFSLTGSAAGGAVAVTSDAGERAAREASAEAAERVLNLNAELEQSAGAFGAACDAILLGAARVPAEGKGEAGGTDVDGTFEFGGAAKKPRRARSASRSGPPASGSISALLSGVGGGDMNESRVAAVKSQIREQLSGVSGAAGADFDRIIDRMVRRRVGVGPPPAPPSAKVAKTPSLELAAGDPFSNLKVLFADLQRKQAAAAAAVSERDELVARLAAWDNLNAGWAGGGAEQGGGYDVAARIESLVALLAAVGTVSPGVVSAILGSGSVAVLAPLLSNEKVASAVFSRAAGDLRSLAKLGVPGGLPAVASRLNIMEQIAEVNPEADLAPVLINLLENSSDLALAARIVGVLGAIAGRAAAALAAATAAASAREEEKAAAAIAKTKKRAAAAASAPWACARCTFSNPAGASRCSMCGGGR